MMIKTTAVVGAGNMGSGIAQKIATEGFQVTLVDSSQELAEKGRGRIQAMLQQGVERRIFSQEKADAILGRVHCTADIHDLKETDLVIEAIFEDLDIKRDLFKRLGEVTRPDALLATNTSSFLVKDIAEGTPHPERVLGLHYFFHPAKNRLVEVIGHEGTSQEALAAAWDFQLRIGKTPITSLDAPGFVVNRFFVPWLVEAVRLHDEGISIATIEQVAKDSFGVGMGPFELMNVTGVPITLHASRSLAENLGEFYAPPALLSKQINSGENWSLEGEADLSQSQTVVERLQGVVFHIASQLVSEGVSTPEDTDIGARVGLRWPLGPFELMNQAGIDPANACSSAVEKRYHLEKPQVLAKQAQAGTPFNLERVRLMVHEGVASIEINRPDQLNALDPETMAQLGDRFRQARDDQSVLGIILEGAGKAFVAGADVKYFVDNMEAGRVDEIVAFASSGQDLFKEIADCPKRVVCKIDGLALGGGAELALACHVIVASARSSLAFPETGIGIYPGLGGTQRLTARLGKGLARYLIYTGEMLHAKALEHLGLAWRVVSVEELDQVARQALNEAPVGQRLDLDSVEADFKHVADYLASIPVKSLASGSLTLPAGDRTQGAARKVVRKALNALMEVERLTALAESDDSLESGLKAETEGLHGIFSHPNALEGMTALLGGRRPNFQK